MHRRHFLSATAALTALSAGRVLGANERVNVGLIGCGTRGMYVARAMRPAPETAFTAVCDVYETNARRAKEWAGADSRQLRDFREVEGVATRRRDVVSDGVVQGYFLGSYSARKLKLVSTGNAGGNHNLVVSHGEDDLPALLSRMGRGVLVTELLGQGVNPVTGDYSRGAAGYWVEGGQIAYPVEEITIAGNLNRMYRDIVAIGSDVDHRGSRHCGSVLIGAMTIAGN